MDELIYLEPDEEITSVIDKLKNLAGQRVGLVVPRDATLLQSVVNLRLLDREAKNLGKVISIVTADKTGRNLASQVGLEVFSSVQEQRQPIQPQPDLPVINPQEVLEIDMSEKVPENPPKGVSVHHFQEGRPVQWRPHQKPVLVQPKPKIEEKMPLAKNEAFINRANRPEKKFLKKIIWPIAAIFVLLIGVAIFLLYPKANINITVPAEDLSKTLNVLISGNITTASTENNVFPGEIFFVEKELEQKFTATGTKNVGGKAKGNVTVTNAWESNARKFTAGTKFTNSGKTFLATSDFTVPGSSIVAGNVVAGTVKTEIEAENPGEDYNIKAGKFVIVGLPAAQQEKIYANSAADFAGGFTKEVKVISQTDFDTAKSKILDTINSGVDSELRSKASGKKILDAAIESPEPELVSSAKVDEEAEEFTLKLKIQKQAMAFAFSAYKEFLIKELQAQAPSDKIVAIPSDEDIGLVVESKAYDKKEMELVNNINAKIASKISAEVVKNSILGKKQAFVENYIKNQDPEFKVEIKFLPTWLKRVPDLKRNVNVTIKYVSKK